MQSPVTISPPLMLTPTNMPPAQVVFALAIGAKTITTATAAAIAAAKRVTRRMKLLPSRSGTGMSALSPPRRRRVGTAAAAGYPQEPNVSSRDRAVRLAHASDADRQPVCQLGDGAS